MSWLSKTFGSDAKKANQRKLEAQAQQFAQMAAAGDPQAGGDAFMGGVDDWARTNNRVNMQSGLKAAGVVAGGSMLAGGAGGAPGALKSVGGAAGAPSAAPAAGGGGFMGGLRSVGGFAKDNPELILGGISAIQGAHQQAQADALNKKAMQYAEQPWNETAGLRKQSLEQMMNPEAPDLSSIYGGSSNPFARPLNRSGFALRSVGR